MRLQSISKTFTGGSTGPVEVFRELSLEIPDGKITAVLGPSGCGKTTLLNIIAGSVIPDGGTISGLSTDEHISYLFQEPRLLPWRTIKQNIDLVLRAPFPSQEMRNLRIYEVLQTVGLSSQANAYPDELSGGMRQRAAVARAFAYPSKTMLMDEPFQSQDLENQLSLIESYRRIWASDKRTTLMVTHDIREALLLAHQVYLFSVRPVMVLDRFSIESPLGSRRLGDDALLELEKRVYLKMSGGR